MSHVYWASLYLNHMIGQKKTVVTMEDKCSLSVTQVVYGEVRELEEHDYKHILSRYARTDRHAQFTARPVFLRMTYSANNTVCLFPSQLLSDICALKHI